MMKSARFSHHKTGGVADELNYLVSDLARGKRFGGAIGPLLDGTTNVNLHGPGLHFDTSFLSDGPAKQIAGFLFPEMVRKHVMSLPRSAFKLMVLDELRRILLIPGANEYVKEMLAQMRKYKTALIGAFQGASQIDEIDPALTTLIFGQCKQHILMRQNDSSEIKRIAEAIGLPGAAQRDIARHPLIEHQRGSTKKSYFTLFSRDGAAPTCGTVAVEAFPPLVWLASSNGEVFDKKQAILKAAADPVDAIHKELARLDAERLVKAN
jgi:type IV secretory pathway VirB4 component